MCRILRVCLASLRLPGGGSERCGPRHMVDHQPIHSELPDNFLEFLQFNGFLDVAVDAQPVAVHQVSLLIRGRQHNDGNGTRALVGFDCAEYLLAADARKLEIEKDEPRGPFETALRIRAAAEEKIECFSAIARNFNVIRQPLFPKRKYRQLGFRRVVFDQKDFVFLGTHACAPISSGIWHWLMALMGSEK